MNRVAIILAAGGSTRMRQPKALMRFRGRPLVLHHVERLASCADEVRVVVGAHAAAILAVLPPHVRTVDNPEWATTHPIDSLRLALPSEPALVWVMPADILPPAPETLAALSRCAGPAVPVDAEDRPGHPVLLDPTIVDRIRREPAPSGLRGFLQTAERVPVPDPFVARDFDDPVAYADLLHAATPVRTRRGGGA